jgi:hypothetical protein
MKLERKRLRDLTLDDDEVLKGIGLYRDLKQIVIEDNVEFLVPAPGHRKGAWGKVLLLNLTFWGEGQADVLEGPRLAADVLAHVAWHHVARRALGGATADAVIMAEAVASAFDLYLVGRLLETAPESVFIETQVPALSDAAFEAGLSELEVERLLGDIAARPEQAFEDLRQLLFDAATTLLPPGGVEDAAASLATFAGHRLAPFLYHYELSNWILHCRARLPAALGPDPRVRAFDAELRAAPDSLAVIEKAWLATTSGSRSTP